MTALSLTNEQNWASMTSADRVAWFNFAGEGMERARGAFVIALEAYAKHIAASGAADSLSFKPDRFIEAVLDAADHHLAPEVREYLGCD
jgi:hypothetical protein